MARSTAAKGNKFKKQWALYMVDLIIEPMLMAA
jgi:hypothetical protein